VVQALLEGRLDEANLWEAADILRIPLRGSYVVIAAQVPGTGRHALPQPEAALRRIGVISAWRLMPDAEVGIAWLPGPRPHLARLADTLRSLSPGLVGVSPCYGDLRHTARNLRRARIALRSAFAGEQVTVFDRDLLAVAAGSDPEVMRLVAGSVLAGLDQIPAGQRPVLLATLGAWLDHGGSAGQAASVLFCHPNTVRHRMRRIEQLTGRSLSDPRGIAELSLAFEIDRRGELPERSPDPPAP
jgi:PucR C-terminal helix-turn-helix domain/GGDEF-like domain